MFDKNCTNYERTERLAHAHRANIKVQELAGPRTIATVEVDFIYFKTF